jgi:hypothetical protein
MQTKNINRYRKKIPKITISFVFTLFLLTSLIQIPSVHADSAVMVYSISFPQSPVVIPGDNITVTLTIINTEKMAIQTIQEGGSGEAYFDPQTGKWYIPEGATVVQTQREFTAKIENIWIRSPTGLLKASENYENVGEIAPGGSFSVSFQLHADQKINYGLYFPELCIDVSGGSNVNFPVPIEVTSETVSLLKSDVPSKISVSGITDITLTLVNKLGCPVKNVMVDITGSEGIDLSPQSIFVGLMEGYSSREITFSLKPHSTGIKNLTCSYQFKNTDRVHTTTIALKTEIIDVSDVETIFQDIPSTIIKGEKAEIDLEVFNAKASSISGVTVVPISDDAKILPSKYFIGEMNTDDIFSAHFTVKTDELKAGKYTLGFKVVFKQENDFYETSPAYIDFTIVEGAPYLESSIIPLGIIIIFGVICLISLVLFIYFRNHKRVVGIWSKMKSTR